MDIGQFSEEGNVHKSIFHIIWRFVKKLRESSKI
jgi:hypothetical protein